MTTPKFQKKPIKSFSSKEAGEMIAKATKIVAESKTVQDNTAKMLKQAVPFTEVEKNISLEGNNDLQKKQAMEISQLEEKIKDTETENTRKCRHLN